MHIGVGENGSAVESVNLACSGSKTDSYTEGSTGNFKPGLDFRDVGNQKGQAQLLKEYAQSHPKGSIKAVAVLNGANEFGFADIAGTCAKHFIETPYLWKNLCSDDPDLFMRFSAANFNNIAMRLAIGLVNVHSAMAAAGYQDTDYKIIAQTYASEIPPAAGLRYPEIGYSRSAIGGCPIWNADADWVDSTVVEDFNRAIRSAVANVTSASYSPRITNVELLDARNAFVGHRLCEAGVGMLEKARVGSWQQSDASDRTEWVKQVNTFLPDQPELPGERAPELLGPDGAAQLLPPGLQQRGARTAAPASVAATPGSTRAASPT